MTKKYYFVYIMTNRPLGVFYVGITSNLPKRVWEHKNDVTEGFTKKYRLHTLVYYEIFNDPENAIRREKRLKRWNREWKIEAIYKLNPEWKDLYEEVRQ